jgi:thioredoxin 1
MKKILYFTASWCQPCKSLRPIIERLSSELPIQIIDVDSNKLTCDKYGVRNVPCIIITIDGNTAGRIVGSNITEAAIRKMFN